MLIIQIIGLCVMAYLLGSISFALLGAKIFGFSDPRKAGSKNPGATNVLRLGGKKAAIFVLMGDLLKGIFPVILAKFLGIPLFFQGIIALIAVLGHIFPVYYGFKGGKGVASTLGILCALNLALGLAASLTWLLVAFVFRYSSLASLVMAVSLPGYAHWLKLTPLLPSLFLLTGMLVLCHRANIKRLILGKENKIGAKS